MAPMAPGTLNKLDIMLTILCRIAKLELVTINLSNKELADLSENNEEITLKKQPDISKNLSVFFFAIILIFSYPITCMAGSTDIHLYIQDNNAKTTENTDTKTNQAELSQKQTVSTKLSAPKTEDTSIAQTTKIKVLLTGSILCGTIGLTLFENEKKKEKRGE